MAITECRVTNSFDCFWNTNARNWTISKSLVVDSCNCISPAFEGNGRGNNYVTRIISISIYTTAFGDSGVFAIYKIVHAINKEIISRGG